MRKQMKLQDLKINSFVTGQQKITGGTGSLPTGHICEKTLDCSPNSARC